MRLLSIIAAASLGISLVSHSFASDPYWDGVVILDESVPGGTALNPLSVGIDLGDGSGFSFLTLTDPNAEGMIQLPPLPVGGQLAVGVHDDYGDEPDDICLVARVGDWAVGVTIEFPLLASMTPGASLGVDYGVLATPPIELMPGDRFTVTDGLLPGWQGIRLVDDSGVPGLQEFVAAVDALPAFNGELRASNILLRLTFVPEPSAVVILGSAVLVLGSLTGRWRA